MSRRTTLGRVTVERRKRVVTYVTVKKEIVTAGPAYVAFGKVVRTLREKAGITQDEVADAVGLTRTSICNIESSRQRIMLEDVFGFAAVLKIKPGKLFALVEEALNE